MREPVPDDPKQSWLQGEPSVDEMMAERITRLVMERDRLNPADVRDALEAAAAALSEVNQGNQSDPAG